MAQKRGRKPRHSEPVFSGPVDETFDPEELIGMLAEVLGIQPPIDILGGRKPSKSQRAVAGAERVVAEALMLDADDVDDVPRPRARDRRADDRLVAEQVRLAHRALAISADCASAHALLGDLADSPSAAEERYRAGVAAGERALGAEVIERYAGELGRIPEARGWLMCRRGLAQCLRALGRHDEAITECETLARLDAPDTIATRFMHFDLLLTQGHFAAAREVCVAAGDESFSGWAYARALVEFAATGDTPAARRLLAQAVKANPRVPRLMLSGEQVEPSDVLIEVGSEDEAAMYVRDSRATWLDVPGALAWLRSATATAHEPPDRERRAPRARDLDILKALPRDVTEEWQVDLHRLRDRGWSFNVASDAGDMLVVDIASDRPGPEDLWALLADAMRRPRAGDPRRPAVLAMRKGVFPRTWAGRLKRLGIVPEERESLDVLDRALAAVDERIAAHERARAEETRDGFDLRSVIVALTDLPQDPGEVWEADVRRASAWVTGEGEPYRPWLTLVASRTGDRMIGPDITLTRPDDGHVLRIVVRAVRAAECRPERVEVADAAVACALAEALAPAGIAVEAVNELPLIDRMDEAIAAASGASDALRPLAAVPGMTDDLQRSLYAAAATFYRARPWRQLPADTAIDVRGADGRLVHVVVMGQSGVQQGLAIYEDRAALDAARAGDDAAVERGTSLAVMFGEAFEIHVMDHDRIESRGFEVAGPEAWPLVIRLDPGLVTRPPLAWEAELITACLRDVPAFVAAVPPPRRGWLFGRYASLSEQWTAPSGVRLSWT
jgi:tetratricopeptide (TPR) repeat protein